MKNSSLPAGKVIKVYKGAGDVENRMKQGKKILRWDNTSCRRFANQAVFGLQALWRKRLTE